MFGVNNLVGETERRNTPSGVREGGGVVGCGSKIMYRKAGIELTTLQLSVVCCNAAACCLL